MLAPRHPWLPHPRGGRVDPRAAARPATAARAGDEHEERPISDDKPRGGLLSRLRGRGSDDRPEPAKDAEQAYADPAADRGPAPEDATASDAADPQDQGTWVHHDGTDGHEGWLYHYADGTIVDADGTVYELTGDEPAEAVGHDGPAEAERERAERAAAEQAERERAEQAERERAEQAERERAEQEQAAEDEAAREQAEREQAERERAEREEAERKRAEQERAEKEEAAQAERERAEEEQRERERAEAERVERERAEREQEEREQEEQSAPAERAAATAATIAAAGSGTDGRPTEEARDDESRDDESRDEADEATTDEAASAEDERPTATERSAEEAPTEQRSAEDRKARRTPSVPAFVEYSPSEAPRYALGVVAALAAVGAVLVGFSAVADSSGSDLVLAAVLALVAAAALWLLERWSSTVVTVRDSTLEVERRGSTDTFDLRDPDLAVDLDEDQRSPSWSATFAEPEGERVTLRRTHVKVAQFVAIVEHHRSHLHERD